MSVEAAPSLDGGRFNEDEQICAACRQFHSGHCMSDGSNVNYGYDR